MIREIKFRGLRTDGKGWVYGDLLSCRYTNPLILNEYDGNEYEVIPFSVGQYTGLKDKNGWEIYEGDKVFDHTGYGVIGYYHSGFRVTYNIGSGKWLSDYLKREFETIEIIGNIHEGGGHDE